MKHMFFKNMSSHVECVSWFHQRQRRDWWDTGGEDQNVENMLILWRFMQLAASPLINSPHHSGFLCFFFFFSADGFC